jgi:hypothetical protein
VNRHQSGTLPPIRLKTLILRQEFRSPRGPDRRRAGRRGERFKIALSRRYSAFCGGPTWAPIHIVRRESYHAADARARQALEAAGLSVAEPDVAAFQATAASAHDAFRREEGGATLLDAALGEG